MKNDIVRLSGKRFQQEKYNGKPGPVKLPSGATIRLAHLINLYDSLVQVQNFWSNNALITGALVSVYYNRIVAKSNRISGFLRNGKNVPNESIVGAKFSSDQKKHIITHFIDKNTLSQTINRLSNVISLFKASFPNGQITDQEFNETNILNTLNYTNVTKTDFKKFLRDSYYLERFGIETADLNQSASNLVTFYRTNTKITDILMMLGIEVSRDRILDETTVLLDEKYVEILFDKASYLVSMAVEDITRLSQDDFYESATKAALSLSEPGNEPTIGVFDTLFDKNVYFSDWVDYHDEISDEINKTQFDYRHGTAVTSLIVDGHNLNPRLDDGLGNFKVRHFGVSLASGFNSFSIIRQIRKIVRQNSDIRVWNLSLGSDDEIRNNFISAEAATLDEIQFEYDVIFVIAGTNNMGNVKVPKKIGAPADSLNSIVVNSVDINKNPADFTRSGVVLSFFTKPDIAYYGGGNGDYIQVIEPFGPAMVAGTSFAAPLIARKLSYMIDVLHLSREVAKALLIDSAIGWNMTKTPEQIALIGNGVVPISMNDIIQTSDDEIKFIVSDTSEQWNTYNYNFPVPIKDETFPYIAKATMVYFPKTSRNQGVDYTNTELNIKFGRLDKKGIRSINKDKQYDDSDDIPSYLFEKDARREFRKWDNVKHIGESFTGNERPRKILNEANQQWGMSIKTADRLTKKDGIGLKFGVVVTLKAMDGVNRFDEFVQMAGLSGWLVSRLSVENEIKLRNQAEEELSFE